MTVPGSHYYVKFKENDKGLLFENKTTVLNKLVHSNSFFQVINLYFKNLILYQMIVLFLLILLNLVKPIQ